MNYTHLVVCKPRDVNMQTTKFEQCVFIVFKQTTKILLILITYLVNSKRLNKMIETIHKQLI